MLSEHILYYSKPASVWTEALPLGNGRIGAMVFGGVERERIALNEDTMWSGYPFTLESKDAPAALAKARALMDAGDFHAAQHTIEQEINSDKTEAYMPLGDLIITRDPGAVSSYRRSLDISTGIHTTSYTCSGAAHTITSFIPNPEPQALVIKHTCDVPGSVSFEVSFESPIRYSVTTRAGRLAVDLECPGHAATDDSAELKTGHYYYEEPEKRGIRALMQVVVETDGGSVSVANGRIKVTGADSAALKLCVRTSFAGPKKHPFTEGLDYVAASDADAVKLEKTDAAALLRTHIADFQPLMERVDLVLEGASPELPTDERLAAFAGSRTDNRLYELLFNYGRYLMVAGSRPGTQATNLQGIWNENPTPPWRSNYTVNINTEMNYYPAEIANLTEMHGPMFDLIEKMCESGKETARVFYGMNGSACNHNTDLWGRTNPVGKKVPGSAVWSFWPFALPWMCRDMFDHYLYTLDEDFLRKRALPVQREAVRFCLDFMTKDENGHLRAYPATSPENNFIYNGKVCSVALSSTCTNALVRELLKNYLETLDILGVDDPMRAEAAAALPLVRPYEFGSKGQLLEWDREYEEREPHHRHTSHLVGLYPGHEISPDRTPALAEGARRTLELRGDDGTGWSLGWKICFWARLNDGDHALKLIKNQLRLVRQNETTYVMGGGTYPNMFDAHPPFQIDGNFGACAGICELMLHSLPGEIQLLPALPSEWPDGHVRGLKAMGNLTVDIDFSGGRLKKAVIEAHDVRALPVKVMYNNELVAEITAAGKTVIER